MKSAMSRGTENLTPFAERWNVSLPCSALATVGAVGARGRTHDANMMLNIFKTGACATALCLRRLSQTARGSGLACTARARRALSRALLRDASGAGSHVPRRPPHRRPACHHLAL